MIRIEETVANILATKDVAFKKLSTDEKTGAVTLVTPVNDNFSRAIIVVNKESIGVGVQGPNDSGQLITTFQPVSEEIMKHVSFGVEAKETKKKATKGDSKEEPDA